VATEVTIPNLGYTMTVAKVLGWLKSVGDPIVAGETLFEIETDKVSYEIESPASGVVRAIFVNIGDEVPVGGTVAVIGGKDEEIDIRHYQTTGRGEQPALQAARPEALPKIAVATSQPEDHRLLASPVAKKIAKERGIDLSLIKGSGRSGRIRMADVERYLGEARPGKVEGAPSSGFLEVAEIIPMTTMRRTIAQRLSQSFHDAPHFNLCAEVDMTEARRLRQLVGNRIEDQVGTKLSLNDIFIKAVAVTLRDHPRLNARLQGDRIEILGNINVGLAVALKDGLIVPALERADEKRLGQIARERNDLVERARGGRLTLEELERGTFTVSSLGMFDITFFTSILNPPQSGILSIGKMMERAVVKEGSIVIRPIVEMSLTVDHRIVDGAIGAQFLQDLKRGLEDPYLLF
jgi:pyruvate dehydrogenase E2 component (dihydrolipoamide acetyltransferase)